MNYINEPQLKGLIRCALKEDIGKGDITTDTVIPAAKFTRAVLLAKENCVVCGLSVANLVFGLRDQQIKFKPCAGEGDFVKKGRVLARISGNSRSILSAERVALNFLSLLSAVATRTRKFVNAVKPYQAKILDTRKTIPGLRILQKYAVRIGGGYNHRLSLDEMILVKDNHIKVTGGYRRLRKVTEGYQVEIEVKNLKEFKEALKLNPDIIMLDNMKINDIKKAVKMRNQLSVISRQSSVISHQSSVISRQSSAKLEVSGGVTLKNIKQIAATGVEMISVGELTHSLDSVDISLEIL